LRINCCSKSRHFYSGFLGSDCQHSPDTMNQWQMYLYVWFVRSVIWIRYLHTCRYLFCAKLCLK
jgi:hypothetical protein